MTTLHQDLRTLVANHGFEMIHTTLHEMMRQDYEFLSKIFTTAVPVTALPVMALPVTAAPVTTVPVTAVPVTTAPTVSEPPAEKPLKKIMKITVRKAVEELLSSPVPPTPAPHQIDSAPQHIDLSTIPSEDSPVNTIEMPAEKSKFRSPAEMKRYQKEAEMKKRAELDAKGISVSSLMTRENLKKWIEDDGKTYAWVAREMIGCAETLVSNMAKNYGIQSKNSKRRAFITARI